jgi:2-polyprenyl-3-methyl-5-hydroxy-6-metoxy-1,4-benzoquinol methylase
MHCRICKSLDIKKISIIKPYIDKNWTFELFHCSNCNTRFFTRDQNINYHETLHSDYQSPYESHYETAFKLKQMMQDDLEKSEAALCSKSPVIQEVVSVLKQKNKSISILEIGCSTGYVTAYLQMLGFKNSLGIDISKSAIEFASLTFGNFYAQKEKNKKYDVIFHTGLIGCVDNPIEFLEYYLSLLNNDGVMIFNAPDVESVQEINENWVSTPPPDLIYLFKKSVFSRFFSPKYKVSVYKTLTPMAILKKLIYKIKGNKIYEYPKKFHSVKSKKIKLSSKLAKIAFSKIIAFLVKVKIIKHYSDEYGLIVKIKKYA